MDRECLGGRWACKERGPVFKVGDHTDSSVGSISVQIPQIGCNLAPGAQTHTNPFQLIKSRQILRPDPAQPNRLAGRRLSPPYFLVWIDCSWFVRFSPGLCPSRLVSVLTAAVASALCTAAASTQISDARSVIGHVIVLYGTLVSSSISPPPFLALV